MEQTGKFQVYHQRVKNELELIRNENNYMNWVCRIVCVN